MNRISPARKILGWLGALVAVVLLTGCEFTLTNLTPPNLPENPSNIYTIQLRAAGKAQSVVDSSIRPQIVIDGQVHDMKRSALGEGIFEYDYALPAGRDEFRYYFLTTYSIESNGRRVERDANTEVFATKVQTRNVIGLTANRGPVGARIGVLGRGFTANDVIYFEGNIARTVFESQNALAFYVPSVEPNRNYRIALGGQGTVTIGTFQVDPSAATVNPSSLTIRTGERQNLTFSLSSPAPTGGVLLDVTTDIPDSVIMPEVIVPQGQTTVVIPVQGGRPGSGSLFLKGFGTAEITIPVTVNAR